MTQSNLNSFLHPESFIADTRIENGIVVPLISEKSEQIMQMLDCCSGDIPHPLTNDRAFRGILSFSENVRKNICAILLDKTMEEILSAEILNPISFGQRYTGKETEQDCRILVNGTILLDIELQNLYVKGNAQRFLLYIARNYDSIERGDDYSDLKASLFIGITNYPFDPEEPEFYSRYRLVNIRTHRLFFPEEDFFGMNVLNLGETKLADESDVASGRLFLAKLIRAKTWEEMRDLATQSAFALEVAEIMSIANADVREREELESRRRFVETQATIQHMVRDLKADNARATEKIHQLTEERDQANARIADLEKQLKTLQNANKNNVS